MMKRDAKRKLRKGFTTGTAAAAAAKAALSLLAAGKAPDRVSVHLLNGEDLTVSIHSAVVKENSAICTVIKDAGDDPDITHKAEIGARVWTEKGADALNILGGEGVGTVTKPGLEIPPGQPAINLGPRKMISMAVNEVREKWALEAGVNVEVFVKNGLELSKKTLNHRLGIVGGLSILGTTGLVKPLSHEAYTATITSAMSVAKAVGADPLVFTTGRRTEKHAQALLADLPEEAFIQIGDFFKMSVTTASEKGFGKIILAVFFGKALKMALGFPHTHAGKARLTMDRLAQWTLEITADKVLSAKVAEANTARHAFNLLMDGGRDVIARVGEKMIQSAKSFIDSPMNIQSIIFDFDGAVAFDSEAES